MKSEDEPITDDEWLLRRIRIEQFRSDKVPLISPNAFEPRIKGRDPDTNGISLYREACLADPADILATVAEEKRQEYGIVRIPMSLLHSLGMTAVIDHDDRIKGHIVIPEFNSTDYEQDKASFTPIKLAFAIEASKDENIVRAPQQSN